MNPTLELDEPVTVEAIRLRLREDLELLEAAERDGVPPRRVGDRPDGRRALPHSLVGIEREIRFLRQLLDGLDRLEEEAIPADRAGYGSRLYVRDLPSGRERVNKLVVGDPDPRDAGQVPIESTLGRALLGARRGDLVAASLPERAVLLRVFNLLTLPERLGIRA